MKPAAGRSRHMKKHISSYCFWEHAALPAAFSWNVLNDKLHPFELDCQVLAHFLSRQTEYIAFDGWRSLGKGLEPGTPKRQAQNVWWNFQHHGQQPLKKAWRAASGEGVCETCREWKSHGVQGEAISSFDNWAQTALYPTCAFQLSPNVGSFKSECSHPKSHTHTHSCGQHPAFPQSFSVSVS